MDNMELRLESTERELKSVKQSSVLSSSPVLRKKKKMSTCVAEAEVESDDDSGDYLLPTAKTPRKKQGTSAEWMKDCSS